MLVARARHRVYALLVLIVCCMGCAGPRYPVSDHFDGKRFHNPEGADAEGFWGLIRWKLRSDAPDWVSVNAQPGDKPPARVGPGELRVTFVGHATLLLQFDSINVLTDPIWSERASPVSWLGPRRVRPPGIRFEDLPAIDLVVVSHDHYDHMDLPTLRRLEQAHSPVFVVPIGSAELLRDAGLAQVEELDWWQALDTEQGLRVTCVPAQHFSARGLFDRDERLWGGYVFSTRAGPIFFAGDTAMSSHFAQVYERFGPMRLAVLPIGAYLPRWFMKPVHIDPAQAVEAHQALHAQQSVGMHFGTFHLADESQNGALEDLGRALEKLQPRPNFAVLDFGEGRMVPGLSTP